MPNYLRIATEEAFAPPELILRYRKLLDDGYDDPGFRSLWGFYSGAAPRATALAERIQDLGERRLQDMDETGIAMQILELTAPGVQVFDLELAEFVAPQAVIEQRRQDGTVTLGLERVRRRRDERRLANVRARKRPASRA